MAFSSEVLTLEVNGHVATLWLDRPDARNAMGRALFTDLPLAAKEVAANTNIRVLVIAAKGPAFTVGLDLKTMGGNLGASSNAQSSEVALTSSLRATFDFARVTRFSRFVKQRLQLLLTLEPFSVSQKL